MIRKRWLVGILVLAANLLAEESPPFLSPMRGVVFSSVSQRDAFTMKPGVLGRCEKSDVTYWITYRCLVDRARAEIARPDGTRLELEFDKVNIHVYPNDDKGSLRQYQFLGSFREKTAAGPFEGKSGLVLWNYDTVPNPLRGRVELGELGVTAGIVATLEAE